MSTFARKQFAGSLFESGADTKQVALVVDEILGDQIIETFADGDTTPSVATPNALFKTSNTGATTITDLDDGYSGQIVTVLFGDANTTVDFTASGLVGNGGADWTPAVNDSMRCIYDGTDWYCCVCSASGGGGLANVVEDTSPQLGGNLDVQANSINTSTVNGNIDIQPNGTGNVVLGNYTFDADQTVGAGQDNYVLTYDNGTGLISLEVASGGLANVVEDTSPQLGGNLDPNNFNMTGQISGTTWTMNNNQNFVITGNGTNTLFLDLGTDLQLGANDGTTDVIYNHNNSDCREVVTGTRFNSIQRYWSGFSLFKFDNPLFVKEAAAAVTDASGYGQIWVKNDTPNTLWFTDDGGTDYQLNAGGLANVVEDTSPQLGANLDCNGFGIDMDNNDYISFRDTGGTLRVALGVDTGNDLRVGDSNYDDMYLMNPVLMTIQGATAHLGNSSYGAFQARGSGVAGISYPQWGDSGNQYYMGYAQYKTYANQSDTVDGAYINAAWYSDDASAYTLTLEASSSTNFPVGGQFTIWNEGSGTLTINEGTGDTLYVLTGTAVTDSAGGCTMGQGGYATVIRKSAATWLIMGAGITP